MATKTRYEQMRDECVAFHNKHPEVWELFCRFTLDRIRYGFKKYSAKAIMERVRWETAAGSGNRGNEFKVNDHYTAFYARAFMRQYPEHDGFFRTREQKSKSKPSVPLPPITPRDVDNE